MSIRRISIESDQKKFSNKVITQQSTLNEELTQLDLLCNGAV